MGGQNSVVEYGRGEARVLIKVVLVLTSFNELGDRTDRNRKGESVGARVPNLLVILGNTVPISLCAN